MNGTDGRFRLFGDSRSGNCYKAALMLRLLGKPFDWVETDVMARATRTTEFLAKNPNGRVPLLQLPDGRYLAESNAMLLHLAEGSRWIPQDAYQRALVYQWMFFEQYTHEPAIAVARFIVLFAKTADSQPERMKLLTDNGYAALGVMERQLGKTPFIAGDEYSVADIALYAYTHVAEEGGFDLAASPAVVEWLARVKAQPGHVSMTEACR